MTKKDFLNRFYILYDKVASEDAPGYTVEEVSVIATQAQEELMLTYYDSKERALIGTFESTEKIKVYLDELVRKADLTLSVPDNTNFNQYSVYTTLPDECLFQIMETAMIGNEEIRVKPVTHDYIEANKDNPYKSPIEWIGERTIWRVNYNDKKVELISKDTIPTSYRISYIKYLEDINLSVNETTEEVSELDPITHFELLNIAIRIASIATDTNLYQIRDKEAENNK